MSTLDELSRTFGVERFTVQAYWRECIRRPEGAAVWGRETKDEFDALLRRGEVVEARGPRGGMGYRLSDEAHRLAQLRLAARERAAVRARKKAERVAEAEREHRLNQAVILLLSAGYTVTPPKKA